MPPPPPSQPPPTRVAIIGAGASGMSAAYALSRHPSKFIVTVFDKELVPGGMATSLPLDASEHGAEYINDGVQGCSPAFANTLRTMRELGFEPSPVGMQISFGLGTDDGGFWSNVFPSNLTRQFERDVARFGKVLKVVKKFEAVFAFVPVRAMLRLFRFSAEFGDKMVFPLVALFFGTGNQTPFVSSAILARVFEDRSMRLFEYDDRSLLAGIPTMYAFPRLDAFYAAWKAKIEGSGCATFRLGHEVTRVVTRAKGRVTLEFKTPDDADAVGYETFDEVIFACDADTALKILGERAGFMERRVLGSVKYLHDVTITHTDAAYMRKHYETAFDESLAAPDAPPDVLAFARDNFRPLYYTYQYPHDRAKLEMSFDLTHYQPQFRGERPQGPPPPSRSNEHVPSTDSDRTREPPFERHVFQTIFLDRDGSERDWTVGEIAPERRIAEKWWKQQSHRWQHYARVVPWMMWLNDPLGGRHTQFAGAWTVLNMHEIAVTSGFAAAYRLGAEYPYKGDEECERLFRLCLGLSHGVRMRKEDRKGFFS